MLHTQQKKPNSRISKKFLAVVLGLMVAIFSFVYIYSVPLIKQTVFEVERNASRLALNNVFEITNRMYASLEEYRQQALDSHQRQLQTAVSLAESFLRSHFREALKNGTPLAQARRTAFSYLRDFTYGNNDYIFVADYNNTLLSHPDPRFHGKQPQPDEKDSDLSVVADLVKLAKEKGEATYRYKWQRLAGSESLDKFSYVRDFPQWGFVIGSGVYLDDVEEEVRQRTQTALADLRHALSEMKIAKTGYMYVFDSKMKMLIHPNKNLDGLNFADQLNPVTQRPIAEDLIKVADSGRELHYRWDRPDDPGNYEYEKLSLVRYMPGFDWYICSSVYLDELRASSLVLSDRIMVIAGIAMAATLLIAWVFVRRLTQPLEKLAETALRVSSGDLSARTNIRRDDEVGILANSFNDMVKRLKSNIDSLDSKVKQRTEELLETNAQAQRMSAVGQLAGGLAHDFNNLMTVIMGNLLLARDRFGQNKELNDLLTPALRASKRSSDITQRLLTFSRRQPLRPQPVIVDDVLAETVTLTRSSLPANIELEFIADSDSAVVETDAGNLENALVNLALNARDAMPDGGKITLSSKRIDIEEPVLYDEEVSPGSYVLIQMEDQGSGFSEDTIKHAFEPFYSTKKNRNNSGLGLSMVYGFVKQSMGYIRIQSAPAEGARISLLLPLSDKAPLDKQQGASTNAQLADSLFLLVEDDEDVRDVVREQLMGLGIHVIEASHGEEAVELIQSLDRLDGLLSDVIMPGQHDGYAVARAMAERFPDSIILLMSGYDDVRENDSGSQPPLIRKPFDRRELAEALDEVTHQLKPDND